MAEGGSSAGSEGASWESWLGGWMQTAKEKSQTAYEFVKKDLAEFGNTVQKETEKAVELTKGSLHSESTTEATKKVKAGLVSFLDNISKALVIPHDEDDYVPMKVAADGSGLYDRGKARLHALQLDASTYMDPPRGPPEQYHMWLESFSLDQHKGEISELLVSKVEVRALYTKLVPSEVSNADFWQRYFYRVHQLQCDEARKQALMMRADQTGGKESVSWDDDDEDDEEDDGNHSDWEKMPRPPQSYAAQQKDESVIVSGEASASPQGANSDHSSQDTDAKDQSNPELSQPSGSPEPQARPDHGAQAKEKQDQQVVSMETSVSAFAAEPSLEPPQQPKSVSSHNVDASGDSSGSSAVEVLANPWSLHIPEDDLASASDAVEGEVAEKQASRPSASPRSQGLPFVESSEGSAAGAESTPQASALLVPTVEDAACAAADFVSGLAVENQQQLAEVSTAGSAEPAQPVSVPESSTAPPKESSEASEASMSQPPSRPEELNTVSDMSCTLVKSAEPSPHNETMVETLSAEKQADSVAKSDPQQGTVNSSSKETEFVPVNVIESGTEKAEATSSSAAQAEVKTEESATGKTSNEKEIGMRVKGDMVVVGDRDSPSSTESTDTKDLALDEDWEQDFDVEITEDDLKAAEDIAKRLGENLDENDDDWENWE